MPRMTYSVISHDAWGNTDVGSFPTLEQAREVFVALQSDRWFVTDGSVRGLSIVERRAGAEATTVERFRFSRT